MLSTQSSSRWPGRSPYALLGEAMRAGYLVAEHLPTMGVRGGTAVGAVLTDLGYAHIGIPPRPRMRRAAVEYVRRDLHRLIPNSDLEPTPRRAAGWKTTGLAHQLEQRSA